MHSSSHKLVPLRLPLATVLWIMNGSHTHQGHNDCLALNGSGRGLEFMLHSCIWGIKRMSVYLPVVSRPIARSLSFRGQK